MNFYKELAEEIVSERAFHADMNALEAANIRTELQDDNLIDGSDKLQMDILRRLLQAALIFAQTDVEKFQEYAQRISTATLRVSDNSTSDLFACIQGRLKNFPALRRIEESITLPNHVPISLQYEFIDNRLRHTIVTSDSSKHILTSFQLDSWNTINNGRSATLSGPTSAGKSYVLLLSLVEKFRTNRIKTAAYVVPTRALINQVSDDATEAFREGGLTGTTITSIPVDISSGSSEKILYVVTQERLDALLIASPGLDFDLIIVDEAQMIGDGSRGVLLESAMDRISAQTRDRQILFSGPLIDNPSYFGEIFQIKNFGACTSKKTPVTQNIVFLDYIESPDPYASVKSYSGGVKSEVALVHLPVRLLAPLDKISYISYTFGKSGASIVYAAGKADAEKIATKITIEILDKPELDAEELEFIDFVKKNVHKDYALVTTLRQRVGFHYGYMPSLLRKQLENRFRERKINYLVCTSTLLHGLNLPAKNIFLLNPTTGRGNPISGPDFWNLSGRVGRLGKELEGNVFLIDYDAWESKPLSEGKGVIVSSALKDVVMDRSSELIEFLADENISSDIDPELEITLGKLEHHPSVMKRLAR